MGGDSRSHGGNHCKPAHNGDATRRAGQHSCPHAIVSLVTSFSTKSKSAGRKPYTELSSCISP